LIENVSDRTPFGRVRGDPREFTDVGGWYIIDFQIIHGRNSLSATVHLRAREIYGVWPFVFFRHAAPRRNVRTAPTMMPKQYTHKRALRLRQNSLLKLALNLLRALRSICESYNMRVLEHAKSENDFLSVRHDFVTTGFPPSRVI